MELEESKAIVKNMTKMFAFGGLKTDTTEAIDTLLAAVTALEESKNGAYSERNHVVAALARMFPSYIAVTNIDGWDEEWHGCVYINLPSGQISYHYHDSEHYLFDHLPPFTGEWDGHDKETVHKRLGCVTAVTVTDEMVERAAVAHYEYDGALSQIDECGNQPEAECFYFPQTPEEQQICLAKMKAALTAALGG